MPRKFRNDPGKHIDPFKYTTLKGYQFDIVIRSLNTVFIGIDIDLIISKLKAN